MYQVMLVDDEYYVRKSIQNRIHWNDLECSIAAEAENGTQALELIGKLKPDIVLVDIMMPEMDGLELISRAREISPGTQFAILSGYDDFLYTKEAIKLQVIDYIKKPVDSDELEAAVRVMIKVLETNRQEKKRLNDLVGQVQDLNGLKIERALNETCGSPEGYRALNGLLKDDLYAWVLLFLIPPQESTSGSDRSKLKADLAAFLQDSGERMAYAATSDEDANEIRILLPATSVQTAQEVAEGLDQLLRVDLAGTAYQRVYISHSKAASLPRLFEQYNYALRVLKSKLFRNQAGMQPANELKVPSQDEITAVFALLENVKRCIAVRQFNRLEVILDQLFSNKTVTSVHVLEDALFYLYGLAREYAGRCKAQLPESYEQKLTGSHALLVYDNLQDLKEQTMELLLMVFCEGSPIDDEEIASQVKKYIEDHYSEDVSLKSVAGMFYLNASYLSSLFKRKIGKNFNKYLETIRIEHAKTLLTSLNVPVNEIAVMSGYSDPNYFAKAFKKRTGKTPSEYKETAWNISGR